MNILVSKFKNSTVKERQYLNEAKLELNKIINSQEFKKELYKIKFDSYVDKDHLYAKIKGNVIVEVLEFWYSDRNVSAWTYPNSDIIKINTKYWNEGNASNNAKTLAHEALHLLGYEHSNIFDQKNVPYAIGNLVRKLSIKYKDKTWKCYRPWYYLFLFKICKFR